MKKLIFLTYISILVFSCQENSTPSSIEKFRLHGKTNNIPDGTQIYFVDILTNQIFDSVAIYKNSFQIERVFPVYPAHIYLHTKDYAESKIFWAENSAMTFDASTSNFNDAKITGSKTQNEYAIFIGQIDTIESEEIQQQLSMDFVKNNPDSRISVSMLAGYAPDWGKAKVKTLFDGLSKENKESVYGLQVAKYIKLNKNHEVGDRFTDFEMKNNEGEVLKLSEHLGRVTLLEFWASWCGPCRKQNPGLVKTYKKYKAAGFEIFSVSLDFSEDSWKKAIIEDNLTWNHVSDLKGRNSTAGIIYGINAIPDNLLIDENGIIVAKYLWGEELNEAIDKYVMLNEF
jgi:peroxiredoxin